MRVERLEKFVGGWFIGNFNPSIVESKDFEVCVKRFNKGDAEPVHFQLEAWEVTAVIEGTCEIGGVLLSAGDVVLIEPLEAAGFIALTDCTLVAIKSPSEPSDKVIGEPQ